MKKSNKDNSPEFRARFDNILRNSEKSIAKMKVNLYD